MKGAIRMMTIALALTAVAFSQASATTVSADSVGTAWRWNPPNDSYRIYAGNCNVAYYSTPESISRGYCIFNLTGLNTPTVCTLKFTATRTVGAGDCQTAVGSPGTALPRNAHLRWDCLCTGPVLTGPKLSGSPSSYVCAVNPTYISFGDNFVFLAWGAIDKDTEWQITDAKLVFY